MRSIFGSVKFRQRQQSLIRMLIGVGSLRVILALYAGSGRLGFGLAATAAGWVSCGPTLLLLALWDWDIEARHPGIRTLFRGCSYGALVGSLLPNVSLLPLTRLGNVPALGAALAGLALTVFSAIALEWLLMDIDLNLPPLSESLVVARLTALLEQIVLLSGMSGSGRAMIHRRSIVSTSAVFRSRPS
jgi:hypothetical protein